VLGETLFPLALPVRDSTVIRHLNPRSSGLQLTQEIPRSERSEVEIDRISGVHYTTLSKLKHQSLDWLLYIDSGSFPRGALRRSPTMGDE
jgi:hypothetical protein